MNNLIGFLIALVYIIAIIVLAEGLRRWRGYGIGFTRKVIHIGAGMLSWFVPLLFDSPWPVVLGCMAFAVVDLLDHNFGFISSMASSDQSNLGTVYFPLAFAAVLLIFWETPPLMVAAIMPLTWGDGLAPVVGRAYGSTTYVIFGHKRSLQGSVTFFLAGGLFTWLALWMIPGSTVITPSEAIVPTLLVMAATTVTEAASPWGLDNLTITVVAIIVLKMWPF